MDGYAVEAFDLPILTLSNKATARKDYGLRRGKARRGGYSVG